MKWLALLFILFLASPALAGTGTITIWGTNASNAQQNVTVTGDDNWVNVTAWNVGGIKTFYVNVSSGTDTLTLNIANITAGQVQEHKVNGTSKNAYQGNNTGWISFTYTQVQGNATFTIQPATNAGGLNFTWGWFQNLWVINQTIINNVIITNTTLLNATNITGDGSGLSGLNYSNITNPPSLGIYTIINVTQNYTIANNSMTLFNVSANLGTVNITLPVMSGSGKIFTVTKTDASSNAVQINVTGNCCIDGVAWANITSQWTSLDLVDINSMWKIT